MKTKSLPLALLVAAGLLSSTATASAYTTYGNTVVNGTTYNLSPGENLYYANLSNAYIPDANLTGADLTYANLSNADLTGAKLTGVYLTYATLIGTTLTNADLTYANLFYANLTGADLTFANLSNVLLTGATVSYSNWTDFSTNSGALGLGSYGFDTSLINYAGPAPVPEPSTYGLIGIGALGVAFAARRKKQKSV